MEHLQILSNSTFHNTQQKPGTLPLPQTTTSSIGHGTSNLSIQIQNYSGYQYPETGLTVQMATDFTAH